MKIDSETGTIDFPNGKLTRCLTRTAFLSTALAKDAAVTVDNEPWATYDLRAGNFASVSVVFESNRLREVRLMLLLPGEASSDWTEVGEMARKRRHDSWLREQFGVGDYRFPWGSVESIYDLRAMCSQIIVRYT